MSSARSETTVLPGATRADWMRQGPSWQLFLKGDRGPATLRNVAYTHLATVVRNPDAPDAFVFRSPDSPAVLSLSLASLIELVRPADLTGCLARPPREAVEFLLARLELPRHLVDVAGEGPTGPDISRLPGARRFAEGAVQTPSRSREPSRETRGSFVQDLASLIAIIAFCAAVAVIAAGIALPRVPV